MPGFCWHLAPNTFFALRLRASARKMDVPRCFARFLRRTSLYGPTLQRLLAAGRSPTSQSRYGYGRAFGLWGFRISDGIASPTRTPSDGSLDRIYGKVKLTGQP